MMTSFGVDSGLYERGGEDGQVDENKKSRYSQAFHA
jgi:hypothetical protein